MLCGVLTGCKNDEPPAAQPDLAPLREAGTADRAASDRILADQATSDLAAVLDGGSKLGLTSSSLGEGQPIDKRHTCDGADLSPPLAWTGAPSGTQSFALIVDDPDAPAGSFTHWVLWALAATRTSLPEGVAKDPEVAGLGRQGLNGFGAVGYRGPCPPAGKLHHYRFTLHALSASPDLPAGTTKRAELEGAIAGKVLAETTLTVTYTR
jgi:Raf kinase inhibitor-like YbhB/YbcL family protein